MKRPSVALPLRQEQVKKGKTSESSFSIDVVLSRVILALTKRNDELIRRLWPWSLRRFKLLLPPSISI